MIFSNSKHGKNGLYMFITDRHGAVSGNGELVCVFVNNNHETEGKDFTICNNPKSDWNDCKEYEIEDGVFGKAVCEVLSKLIEEGKVKSYVRKK